MYANLLYHTFWFFLNFHGLSVVGGDGEVGGFWGAVDGIVCEGFDGVVKKILILGIFRKSVV